MSSLDWVFLLVLSLIWGGGFVLNDIAVQELPPATLVFVRLALAALVLVPIVRAMGYRLPTSRAHWRDFAVMAVLNNVVPFTLIAQGQTEITAGLTSVLNATSPLFAIIVAALFGGSGRPPARSWIGIVLGIAGVAVLVGPEAILGNDTHVGAMLMILCASLCYGFSALWGRRFAGVPPLVAAASQLIASAVILVPVALVLDRPWTLEVPGVATWQAVGVLALFSTALAYVLFFRVMASSGGVNVMLVTLLIPPSAILLGHVFLAEPIVMRQIIGAAIITLALIVIDGRLVAALLDRRA
ncbi:MAG: DMT family transporter [Hyphomicrobium sp.]|nr:DMT family transporter [Hyphomicrobium sp.]